MPGPEFTDGFLDSASSEEEYRARTRAFLPTGERLYGGRKGGGNGRKEIWNQFCCRSRNCGARLPGDRVGEISGSLSARRQLEPGHCCEPRYHAGSRHRHSLARRESGRLDMYQAAGCARLARGRIRFPRQHCAGLGSDPPSQQAPALSSRREWRRVVPKRCASWGRRRRRPHAARGQCPRACPTRSA